MRVIFWAGDSTNTCNKANKYPQTGIAQAFDRYTAFDVVVYDHAINGRSTRSFIDQGRLAFIYDEIKEGDFLFIQFGHNDEKETDLARYTDPDTDFIENLGKFVNVARNKGAIPLFITPLERRDFKDDHVTLEDSQHTPYVQAYHKASERFGVPVADLFKAGREFLEKTGDEPSKRYYMHVKPGEAFWLPEGLSTDNTHLKYEGAMKFGELIARELIKLGAPFSTLVDEAVLRDLDSVYDSNLLEDGLREEYKQ